MKCLVTLLVVCLLCIVSKAQDIIVTNDAVRIDAIVEEVSETAIRYKKANNPTGPTFVIGTDKIASIIYQNGSVQSFSVHQHLDTISSLYEIARLQQKKEKKKIRTTTPPEGPWLLYGAQVKEGNGMYMSISYFDEYSPIYGQSFFPSIEGYIEFAPRQKNMGFKRSSIYLGVQYNFRGTNKLQNVVGTPALNLQYLSFRPAYSIERRVFYSRTGVELGILTNSKLVDNGVKYDSREYCNKVTFGVWQEIGWVIKDHFNIGLSCTIVATNSTKHLFRYGSNGYSTPMLSYSPHFLAQIVLGWRFNPYKLDKKKIEPITI